MGKMKKVFGVLVLSVFAIFIAFPVIVLMDTLSVIATEWLDLYECLAADWADL